jgi:transposase
LLDLETHRAVFTWIVGVLAASGLVKGKTVGVDATTLEANAALRSIVRRVDGQTYEEFLQELAKASGIETPTRADLARLDRKRAKKGSNDDWTHPDDPDAQITKMKDGRTHLGHKQEQAVDLETGAVLGVTLTGGAVGDTQTLNGTLAATNATLAAVRASGDESTNAAVAERVSNVVADKGYHSNATMVGLQEEGVRSYVSEPNRGRRRWVGKDAARDAVYANRRRVRGEHGKALLRLRGELLERPFAHAFETGGMRRTHLRRHENILKRLLVHFGGLNLGLLMRTRYGIGTPRGLQGRAVALLHALIRATERGYAWIGRLWTAMATIGVGSCSFAIEASPRERRWGPLQIAASTTGC